MSQEKIEHYVGIDVSKDKLDVCFLPENRHLQVATESVNKNETHYSLN